MMAVTASSDHSALHRIFVVAFNAAPGATYLQGMEKMLAAGMNTRQILDELLKDKMLGTLYPDSQTNSAFAKDLIDRLMTNQVSAEDKSRAVALINEVMKVGWSRSEVIDAIGNYLHELAQSKPYQEIAANKPYVSTAQNLANKVLVAQYFSEDLKEDRNNLAQLQDVIARVSSENQLSDQASITRLIRGFDQARQDDTYRLFAIAFKAAPGAMLFAEIEQQVNKGQSNAQWLDNLFSNKILDSVFSDSSDPAVFAKQLISNLLSPNESKTLASSAESLVLSVLASGWTKGMVIDALGQFLETIPIGPAQSGYDAKSPYLSIAQRIANQAQVAKFYTETMKGSAADITSLKNVIAKIDETSKVSDNNSIKSLIIRTESGKLQDGYIEGATVFADTDNDGVLDPGEAFTKTDALGQFKLEGGIGNLVAIGGTDTATKLAFSGTFRAPSGSGIISPLTTILSALTEEGHPLEDAKALIVKQLSLPTATDPSAFDPIQVASDVKANASDRLKALEVFKASASVANVLAQTSAAIEKIGQSSSAELSTLAARSLAQALNEAANPIDLSKSEPLKTVLLATAERAGALQQVKAIGDQISEVMQAANLPIRQISSSASEIEQALQTVVKAQTVAQGKVANAISDAVSRGATSTLITDYTGAALNGLIATAPIGVVNPGASNQASNGASTNAGAATGGNSASGGDTSSGAAGGSTGGAGEGSGGSAGGAGSGDTSTGSSSSTGGGSTSNQASGGSTVSDPAAAQLAEALAGIQYNTSLLKSGLLLDLTIPVKAVTGPISAYDVVITSDSGNFAIASTKGQLSSLSRADTALSVVPKAGDSWTISGIDTSFNSPFNVSSGNLISNVLDRINSTSLKLTTKVIAYDSIPNVVLGLKQTIAGTTTSKPYSFEQSIEIERSAIKNLNDFNLLIGKPTDDSIQGTNGSDVIIAMQGNDRIQPGPGADGVILSQGEKLITYMQGDSGIFESSKVKIPQSSSTLSTKDFDVISGFGLNETGSGSFTDRIDLPDGDYTAANLSLSLRLDGGIEREMIDKSYGILRGNYDPIQDRFSLSSQGYSSLLLIDFGSTTEAIVLVGFRGSVADDGTQGILSLTS